MRFQSSLLCTLFLALVWAAPVHAQDADSQPRTVRVSGEGTVSAAPDQATVRFGIVSRAKTAEVARAQNAEAAKNAMNAVRELDVPESKLRMEMLRLQPRREYNPKTEEHEEKGYEASRQVVVEVTNLERLPTLVTRVVQSGANRLEGIDYGLSDRTPLRNDALRQAAQNARDKAQLLVSTLGATLGPVHQIDEQSFGVNSPSPLSYEKFSMAPRDGASPEPDAYAAGEIEVSATVQVVFVLQ